MKGLAFNIGCCKCCRVVLCLVYTFQAKGTVSSTSFHAILVLKKIKFENYENRVMLSLNRTFGQGLVVKHTIPSMFGNFSACSVVDRRFEQRTFYVRSLRSNSIWPSRVC